MKKRLQRIATILCVFAFLFTLLPMTASGAGGGTPLKVNPAQAKPKTYMSLKNTGSMPPRYQDTGYIQYLHLISLEGKKAADGTWDFDFNILFSNEQTLCGGEPNFYFLKPRITDEVVSGTKKGVIINRDDDEDVGKDANDQQNNNNDQIDEIKKISEYDKDKAIEEIKKANSTDPQTVYTAEFTITGNGSLMATSHDGIAAERIHGSQTVSEKDRPIYAGAIQYNVKLTINDRNYAKASISFTDSTGVPRKWELEGYISAGKPKKPKKPPKPKPKNPLDSDFNFDDPLHPDNWPEIS